MPSSYFANVGFAFAREERGNQRVGLVLRELVRGDRSLGREALGTVAGRGNKHCADVTLLA